MTEQHSRKEILKRFRAWHEEHDRQFKIWEESGYGHRMRPAPMPYPPEFYNLRCEAKTRAGTPCKRSDIELNGRCKFHGGFSTGPTSPEGKKKAAMNGMRPKKAKSMKPDIQVPVVFSPSRNQHREANPMDSR
jgi:hypothetical protein